MKCTLALVFAIMFVGATYAQQYPLPGQAMNLSEAEPAPSAEVAKEEAAAAAKEGEPTAPVLPAAEGAATAEGAAAEGLAAAEGGEGAVAEAAAEVPRPAPMSPAKDYPANQNLPAAARPNYRCELCMMVIGRKLQRHELCDGLEHTADVNTCRQVVETLTEYDRYLVDWLYGDGCQRITKESWKNVKPCPAHVVCSWMIRGFEGVGRRTFCQFEDKNYRRSPQFHEKHHIPTKAEETLEEKEN